MLNIGNEVNPRIAYCQGGGAAAARICQLVNYIASYRRRPGCFVAIADVVVCDGFRRECGASRQRGLRLFAGRDP